MELKGYLIKENIHNGIHSRVYRAVRQQDNKPVIIKTLSSGYPSRQEADRFRNQYDILKNNPMEQVINVYDLVSYENGFAIIMEDIGALDLRKKLKGNKLDKNTFLDLAIFIARGLQEIHDNHIIHKDIKPENIVVTGNFEEVRIIDFSISTKLSFERRIIVSENCLEGTLGYISPEQTGRMNRPVDYRTDFYSLGITFYELLCRKMPFRADDSLGMVHQHIAGIPLAPSVVDPAIPGTISAIIMKLIEKNAEDRYKSALGLKKDLEKCREYLKKEGTIPVFSLAAHDFSSKFQVSGKLYGRDRERKSLIDTFEAAAQGSRQMLLVAGYSGVGKSALIHEIYKPNVKHRGFFISGKFDQFKRNIPYSALIQAFDELMHKILGKSEQEFTIWRKKILETLGENGQVIIDVIPSLERVIGKQPELIRLGPLENQNRFKLYFQKFTGIFTGKEHPLTLFLDDLQWADLASLNLIKTIITDTDIGGLLLIGAYRDNEVDQAHPLMLSLSDLKKEKVDPVFLKLAPLDEDELNELICDSLECEKEKTVELTRLVWGKTKGNPFFTGEFLKNLYARRMLQFDFSNRWTWDIQKIEALGVTDNVVELLAGKIKKLPGKSREILKIASCMGNRFDLAVLVIVCGKTREEIMGDLAGVMEEGFVFPQDETFFFSHDRVQEAVYSLIPGDKKKELHYKIGSLVLRNTGQDELDKKIFYITDQLNEAIDLLSSEDERAELAGLNLRAGKKSKESSAYEPSLKYINRGIELAGREWWEKRYELVYSLYSEGAEAAYLNADFELMEKLTGTVLAHSKSLLDKVDVYRTRILAYASQGKYIKSIDTGIKISKELGIKLPKRPGKLDILFELIKIRFSLWGKTADELYDLPELTNLSIQKAFLLLDGIGTSSYFAMPNMLIIAALRVIRLTVRYGFSPYSTSGYATYATILCGILGDIKNGVKVGELAFRMVCDLNIKKQQAKMFLIYYCFIWHYKAHVKEALAPLLEVYKKGLEEGEFEFGCISVHVYIYTLTFTDKNRQDLIGEIEKYLYIVEKLKQEKSINSLKRNSQFNLNLIGKNSSNRHRLKGEVYDEDKMLPIHTKNDSLNDICKVYIFDMVLGYLFGRYDQAVEKGRLAADYIRLQTSIYLVTVYNFYYSLSLLAGFNNLTGGGQERERKKRLNQVRKNQKKMKKWADHAPMNFLHKYYLVEAETARVTGGIKKAMQYYDKAIGLAGEHEYINEQAVCYECAALFYLELKTPKTAAVYMGESRYCYSRWGADEKVKYLDEKYPGLLSAKTEKSQAGTHVSSPIVSDTSTVSNMDLDTILKASQVISGEIELEGLIKKMMNIVIENAGAERGILVLEKEGAYYVEAEAKLGKKEIAVLQSLAIEEYRDFSLQTVQYVLRTRESFVSGDAVSDERCVEDKYIKEKKIKSLLCFPIIHHSHLSALLYLENSLALNVFTGARLGTLNSLSSQIAISLENARLYENLKEQERLKKELEIAEKIQTAIVPGPPEDEELKIAVSMTPAEEVGGDYYDVLYDKEGTLWFAIGDVTGHGVTPGLIMMMAQSSLASMLQNFSGLTPKEVIVYVNRVLHSNIKKRLHEDHFMTMTFLKYLGNGEFLHAGAHIPVIIYRKKSRMCEMIETKGTFLGMIPEISHSTENSSFFLNRGDVMLLSTDGIIEARHKDDRKLLDFSGLQKIVEHYGDQDVETIKAGILEQTLKWCGHKTYDDMTMIVVKRK